MSDSKATRATKVCLGCRVPEENPGLRGRLETKVHLGFQDCLALRASRVILAPQDKMALKASRENQEHVVYLALGDNLAKRVMKDH